MNYNITGMVCIRSKHIYVQIIHVVTAIIDSAINSRRKPEHVRKTNWLNSNLSSPARWNRVSGGIRHGRVRSGLSARKPLDYVGLYYIIFSLTVPLFCPCILSIEIERSWKTHVESDTTKKAVGCDYERYENYRCVRTCCGKSYWAGKISGSTPNKRE